LTINPVLRPFQFRKQPDRRFIDDAMAHAVRVLGAPFFIHKRARIAQPLKHSRQRFAVLHLGFGLLPVLVALRRIVVFRQRFVGQHPTLAVAANAQDGARGAQPVFGRIEKHVVLKGARRLLAEAKRTQLARERGDIGDAELDLDLNRIHACKYTSARIPFTSIMDA